MVVAIAGISGSGKTTASQLLETVGYKKIVTYTSRKPRTGEVDGVDYNFRDRGSMKAWELAGVLWDLEEYFGNLYGSRRVNPEGNFIIVLESNGITKYKSQYGNACLAVLLTASVEEIQQRLAARGDVADISRSRSGDAAPDSGLFDVVIDTTSKTPEHVAFEILQAIYSP